VLQLCWWTVQICVCTMLLWSLNACCMASLLQLSYIILSSSSWDLYICCSLLSFNMASFQDIIPHELRVRFIDPLHRHQHFTDMMVWCWHWTSSYILDNNYSPLPSLWAALDCPTQNQFCNMLIEPGFGDLQWVRRDFGEIENFWKCTINWPQEFVGLFHSLGIPISKPCM